MTYCVRSHVPQEVTCLRRYHACKHVVCSTGYQRAGGQRHCVSAQVFTGTVYDGISLL